MLDRYAIKNILLSVVIMGIQSMITRVILSVFTYALKWQAPQAQVGLTLTYIISGFVGGFLSCIVRGESKKKENGVTKSFVEKKYEKNSLKNAMSFGMTLGTIYMAVLLSISILISANANWDIGLILLRWVLLSASCVLGIYVGEKGLWGLVKKY